MFVSEALFLFVCVRERLVCVCVSESLLMLMISSLDGHLPPAPYI